MVFFLSGFAEGINSTLGTDLPVVQAAILLLLAGKFDNHLWRILLLVAQHYLSMTAIPSSGGGGGGGGGGGLVGVLVSLAIGIGIWWMPHFANRKLRPKGGCVFVTGCDSGMGKATVIGLAKAQRNKNNNDDTANANANAYTQIFAGCYDPKAARTAYEDELTENELKCVTLVALDVTSADSVNEAAETVREWITRNGSVEEDRRPGLAGLVQFHGVAFNGPSAYMPIAMYQRQLDVNFVGTIRVVQALLPLLKESSKNSTYRSRIVLTGTGGGSCSPCPPLLTAYMSSKFALEAYAQSLRQELFMTGCPIDLSVINPGFVKPTMLVSEGTRISASMWTACEKQLGSNVAKDEYGAMLDHFTEYSALQPGTHVSKIVEATEHALLAPVPRSSYKVGIDSKLAPIVGMMPTGARELIARHGIYGKLSPNGTVPGYKV